MEQRPTGFGISARLHVGGLVRDTGAIEGEAGTRKTPEEFLQLVLVVFLVQKVDEGFDPKAGIADEEAADAADVLVTEIEHVGCQ